MRWSLVLASCLLAAGCISNWNGPEWNGEVQQLPHWPDCDGDGWGDPVEGATCLNSDFPPALECPNGGGAWVQNGFDCDDAYSASGSRVGSACPEDFNGYLSLSSGESSIDASNYRVIVAAGREFLIWRDNPVSTSVAKAVCRDWSGFLTEGDELPLAWAGERDVLVDGEEPIGVPESNQELQPLVTQVTQWADEVAPDDFVWRGWIDLTFSEGAWVFTSTADPVPATLLSFCGGATLTPTQMLEGLFPGDESGEFLPEIHAAMRPVLRIRPGAPPCLEGPADTCADGESCVPAAQVLCERPIQQPSLRRIFRVGDEQCF